MGFDSIYYVTSFQFLAFLQEFLCLMSSSFLKSEQISNALDRISMLGLDSSNLKRGFARDISAWHRVSYLSVHHLYTHVSSFGILYPIGFLNLFVFHL